MLLINELRICPASGSVPVAIQQSPEKGCTNLVHYSFHVEKARRISSLAEKKAHRVMG
jgi:hypothetical protein